MRTVYLLQSLSHPHRRYTGVTSNFNKRLESDNGGRVLSTAEFKPWKVVVALRFEVDNKASAFEAYLKSGSGQDFANRHFW